MSQSRSLRPHRTPRNRNSHPGQTRATARKKAPREKPAEEEKSSDQ